MPTERVPVSKPNFTVKDLRDAVPKHCFIRSFGRSSTYLLVDVGAVALFMFCSQYIDTIFSEYWFLRMFAWIVYWCMTGFIMTGLWVIGHECGHHAFCEIDAVSDAIGFVVHTALLV